MQIINKTLAELTPYRNNPRKNDAAVDKVAASIVEFGFKVPVVIDKNGIIVAGHTRYKAAQSLGMSEIPCIVADDLTEEQIKAFRLADNKVGEFAEWDFDLLADELQDISDIDMSELEDLQNMDFDISLTGFEMPEINVEDAEIIEDDVPDDAEARCKLGDIWQLGNHRLICGDCTDINVIDTLMDGAKADMVFTDPPYGMNLDTDFSGM